MIVFNNGTPKGLTKCIPIGDHLSPNSCTGTNAASKKTQKILKKNINSLKINKTTPNLKPSITKKLWYPLKPSIEISLPQAKEINKTTNKLNKKGKIKPYLKKITKDLVKPNEEKNI